MITNKGAEIANYTGGEPSSIEFLKSLKLTDVIYYVPKSFQVTPPESTYYIKALFNPTNVDLLPAIANEKDSAFFKAGPLGLARQIARTSLSRPIVEKTEEVKPVYRPQEIPSYKFTWKDWAVSKLFPQLAG